MSVLQDCSIRYEMVEPLGNGAMGSVHLARDRVLDRLVAIKSVGPTTSADTQELKRLIDAITTEARLLQLLSHPNIVTVHDLIETHDEQQPLLVMEYIEGESLADLLKAGTPLPTDFVQSMALQLGDALDHAHLMGVIHGDIKPGNILISSHGEQAKLVDFGISRVLELAGDKTSGSGPVLGSPRYAAPEVLKGQHPDRASDLFSLSIVLYEMLTGRSPYGAHTPTTLSREVAAADADLSAHALQDLPESLRPVLEKALARDPADRFQSGLELAQALQEPDRLRGSQDLAATQDLTALVIPELPATPPEEPAEERVANESARKTLAATLTVDPRRLLATGAIAAVLTLAIGLLVLRAITPEAPIDGRHSARHQALTAVFPLLQESQRQIQAGQPDVALRLLRRAETLAPDHRHIQDLISRIEGGSDPSAVADGDETDDSASVEAAPPARVSSADPVPSDRSEKGPSPAATNEEAPVRAEQPAAPATGPSARPAVSERDSALPPVTSGPAQLRVDVFSYLSKGVLTVYADREQILLEPFRFVQKKGLLRKKKTAGRLETSIEVPGGTTELRIYVSAEGLETQSTTVAAELPGGQTHTLRLVVAEDGSATAQVN